MKTPENTPQTPAPKGGVLKADVVKGTPLTCDCEACDLSFCDCSDMEGGTVQPAPTGIEKEKKK